MSMASSLRQEIDRKTTVPFHLKLFYKTESFNRLDDFQSTSSSLPPHIEISTWPDCTLRELSHHVASNLADLLPSPPIGTRLMFRLVFPDTVLSTAHSKGPGRFTARSLGTVVIGSGLSLSTPKAFNSENVDPNLNTRNIQITEENAAEGGKITQWDVLTDAQKEIVKGGLVAGDCGGTPEKSLQDIRFVIGDYVDCAIYPPLPNGDIAPGAEAAPNLPSNKSGPAPVYSLAGAGHVRGRSGGGATEFIHPSRAGRIGGSMGSGGGGESWRSGQGEVGSGRGGALVSPRENGFGGSRTNGGGGRFRGASGARGVVNAGYGMGRNDVPVGEWRRGESLPDAGARGAGDYGYKGGRSGCRW